MLIDEGLELLDEETCRQLLATAEVGRVGMTVAALPVILPVNYAYVDGDIVFRTSEGTKLRAAVMRSVIAFEVDAYDPATREGWSVLLVGRAEEITAADELQRLHGLDLATWANGERTHYVRLRAELVTGRRIVRH